MDDRLQALSPVNPRMLAAVVRVFAGSRLERDLLSRAYELVCPAAIAASSKRARQSHAYLAASTPLRKGA